MTHPSLPRCLVLPGLSLLAALVACSPAAPAPATPPAPSSSASVAVSPDPGPGWAPHDPRAVRCGVDDRPRNVTSLLEPPPARALLAEMAAPMPPVNRRPVSGARPRPSMDDFAPPDDPALPQEPVLHIDRLPPTTASGAPAPSSLASMDPQYEVCASLARPDEPLGPVSFDLELASSGAPLRVSPRGPGATTPLVRCLMERACQLQATASPPGQATRLQIPLQLRRDVPPPPPPPAFVVRVDVATEAPQAAFAELQLQLRASTADIMRSCGAVPGRARVRLSLDLMSSGSRGPRRLRRGPMPMPGTRVIGQRTENLEGSVPTPILSCLVNSLAQRSFTMSPAGQRTERLLLTWNP